jgi:hypothetical protein
LIRHHFFDVVAELLQAARVQLLHRLLAAELLHQKDNVVFDQLYTSLATALCECGLISVFLE